MTDNVESDQNEEDEEAIKERDYFPYGEMFPFIFSVKYPGGSVSKAGRGLPFYEGLTRPPMSYPPSLSRLSKKESKNH